MHSFYYKNFKYNYFYGIYYRIHFETANGNPKIGTLE